MLKTVAFDKRYSHFQLFCMIFLEIFPFARERKWYRSIDIPPGEKLEAINGYSISSWVANQYSTVSMCGKSIFAYFLERFRPPNPRDPRVSCESGGPPAPSPTARWEAYNCQKSKEENRTSSAKLTRTKNIKYSWRNLILEF